MNLPSLEWLLESSLHSLEEWELAALARADKHLKAAKLEMAEAVAQREAAGVARFLIEFRGPLLDLIRDTVEGQGVIKFPSRPELPETSCEAISSDAGSDIGDRSAFRAMRKYSRR
jgi:hypothetical protein